MRNLLIVIILIIAVAVGVFYFLKSPSVSGLYEPTPSGSPAPVSPVPVSPVPVSLNSVLMINNTFSPKVFTVAAGTTVMWVNEDSVAHNVESDVFSSGILNEGDTFEHTFDTAGTFEYECTLHPGMTGTIVVQ